jgi:hypothetical protein
MIRSLTSGSILSLCHLYRHHSTTTQIHTPRAWAAATILHRSRRYRLQGLTTRGSE